MAIFIMKFFYENKSQKEREEKKTNLLHKGNNETEREKKELNNNAFSAACDMLKRPFLDIIFNTKVFS